ncbi:MAG: DNA-binding protein [Dehalococcoidia bacterium]|nr:DNA-binding protein [Dehalococcoidia bacterium]
MLAEQPLLLKPEDAARALGIGRTKLYSLLMDGSLESITIGSRRLIPRDALARFIDKHLAEARA